MINKDPFSQFRECSPHHQAVTGSDGRSLSLIATGDLAKFHFTATDAIHLANASGWRVKRLHRVGHNVAELTVAPSR